MLNINIKIDTDNAAFQDNHDELKTILKEATNKILQGYDSHKLRDSNGNVCGDLQVSGDTGFTTCY